MTDYRNMTLREEREARFEEYEEKQRLQEMLSKAAPYLESRLNPLAAAYRGGEILGAAAANYHNSQSFEDFMMNYMEPSVQEAWRESRRLTPIQIPDDNKHRYVSCVGAQGGRLAAAETFAGGVWKEIKDLNRKLRNPAKYKGYMNIYEDTIKDLKNDYCGVKDGYTHREPGYCNYLLNIKY